MDGKRIAPRVTYYREAKKAKYSSDDDGLPNLPWDVLEHVLRFVEIPTLGLCAQVSKGMEAIAYSDSVWEHHVRFMLKTLYDDAFIIWGGSKAQNNEQREEIGLLSQKRPLKSTDLLRWLSKWEDVKYAAPANVTKDFVSTLHHFLNHLDPEMMADECFEWAFRDVSLRTYYFGAGNLALRAQTVAIEMLKDIGHCLVCRMELCDCEEGDDEATAFSAFDPLPQLILFSQVAGEGSFRAWRSSLRWTLQHDSDEDEDDDDSDWEEHQPQGT